MLTWYTQVVELLHSALSWHPMLRMAGTQYHLTKPALGAHTQAAPYVIHDMACFALVLVLSSAMSLYGDPGGRKSQHGHDIRTVTDLSEPSFVKPAGHMSWHG